MSTAGDKPVVIVGGGISGLTAAWRLKCAKMSFVVLESSDRWGGKIRTEQIDGYTLEMGADAFLLRKPWARRLASELDLDDRVQLVNRPPVSTYVLHRGRPVPLPDGLALLVPSKWRPFLLSPLFTPWGKARVALEQWLPPRQSRSDETLARFITRRFGREMLDKVAEPMLAGVFNGEAERQSMLATFPQFPALEREHGSLIRGIRAKRAEGDLSSAPPFFSFRTGAREIVNALVKRLADSTVPTMRLNTAIARITRNDDGDFSVALRSGKAIDASAAVLTTGANIAATIIADLAPLAARTLGEIRYTGIGSAYVAYRRKDVPHSLDGYGLVIPSRARRQIDGMTWASTKWTDRAPDDDVLIRIFFGGPHTRSMIAASNEDLRRIVLTELKSILHIRAEPLLWHVHRWHDAYPQYDLGHLERVSRIHQELPPGVVVAGNAYGGIGVPDCIRQAGEAAQKIIRHLAREQPA